MAGSPWLLESFPKITVGFLARHGLLAKEGTCAKGFESHLVRFIVYKIRSNEIDILTNNIFGPVIQKIKILYTLHGALEQCLFICPRSGRAVKYLIFVHGVWASRRGHGLRVRNGTRAQRERSRLIKMSDNLLDIYYSRGVHRKTKEKSIEHVLDHLRSGGLLSAPFYQLESVFKDEARRSYALIRNNLRSRPSELLSLEKAISSGGSAEDLIDPQSQRVALRGGVPVEVVQASRPDDRPFLRQESQVAFDLKSIRERRWLRLGRVVAWWLVDWDLLHPYAQRVLLVVDSRLPMRAIKLDYINESGVSICFQTIEVRERSSMRDRLFLVCPVRGTLHDRLYFRDGFFASAAAQRLRHASQLGSSSQS